MSFEDFCTTISEVTNLSIDRINADASFQDDLAIDSLQMVNLIVEISSRYGIKISNLRSNGDLKTVGSMYGLITREG